jgi:nucleoside-diphosphate-sugar epimerase
MRVAVTGATGVIGRRVIPLLVAGGHDVTAIIRPGSKHHTMPPAGSREVCASLFDRSQLAAAFAGQDAVINLATHIPTTMTAMMFRSGWRENDRIRSEGARNVSEAASEAGVRIVIQESFGLAYPSMGDAWVDERVPLAPVANCATVPDAEAAVAGFTHRGGRGVALRLAGFYGPDASQTLLMAKSVSWHWVPLPGKPSSYLSSLSHDDAATAVVAALSAPAGVYNVADNEPMRRKAFFDAIAATLHVGPPHFLPEWTAALMGIAGPVLKRSIRLSNDRFRQATGWAPSAPSAADGLPSAIREAYGTGL